MAGAAIRISILANAAQAKKELQGVAGTAEKMGSRFSKLRGPALAAVGGIALLGKASVKAASDSQQSLGATETVFGKFADTVVKTSERAAQQYGLSANSYRENANLIGSLFKNQGVSLDQLAGKTDKMIGTAADLSATFGGTTKEAVEALGSAFKGEFDPLERYGISLKQSTIQAELARRGEDKLTGAALAAAKQRATTALITKQAGGALGAFGRESTTLAGQQQRLSATWEDAKAKLGTALLPILTKAATMFSKIASAIAENPGKVQAFVAVLGGLSAVVLAASAAQKVYNAGLVVYKGITLAIRAATIVWANAQLALNLAMMLNPIGLVVVAIIALVAVFVIAWKKSETFRNIVTGAWNAIKKASVAVWNAVKNAIVGAWNAIKGAVSSGVSKAKSLVTGAWNAVRNATVSLWNGIKNAVRNAVTGLMSIVRGIKGRVTGFFSGAGSWLLSAGKKIISGLVDGIKNMFGAVRDTLGNLTSKLTSWKGPPERDAKLLTGAGESIIQGLIDGFDSKTPEVKKTLKALSKDIATTSFSSPSGELRLDAAGAYLAQGSSSPAPQTVTVKFTAQQISDVQAGREIQLKLDAYNFNGGRRRS